MRLFQQNLRASTATQRGFTIVELLIVIVVIGILATIVIVAYNGIQQRARIAVLQSDLSSAVKTLGIDNGTNGSYPSSAAAANAGAGLNASSGTTYQYTYTSIGNSYCLTGTNSNVTYTVSTANPAPTAGVCPGHTTPASTGVTTLAGSGAASFADGVGVSAQFNRPYSIAVHSTGTVYVADFNNRRIRSITPAGVVTTVAGSGVRGFVDGAAASAQFDTVTGIAVDAAGNIYVADSGNHRIRMISTGGVVSTLAGSGANGYADGTGAGAQFSYPQGVTVNNAGTVYVADTGNHRIRMITPAGVVTTLAGSETQGFANGTGPSAQFNSPTGVTVDSSNIVYVADRTQIRMVTAGGVVTTLAGSSFLGFADGSGASVRFRDPYGIVVDASGNVYVADSSNHRIRMVTPSGTVSTLAGTGTAGFADGANASAQFNNATGVGVDLSGAVYVADTFNNRIRKIQ